MTPGVAAVGAPAPDFALRDQHGRTVRLSSLWGRRAVALVFYPFAFSRVCTGELADLRDRSSMFADADAEVLAVSCDPVYALRAFADAQGYEFSLLSDFWPHGAVASAYGVFDADRGCALRGSFLVDRDGIVRWSVVNAVPDARNLDDYRAALDSIGRHAGA